MVVYFQAYGLAFLELTFIIVSLMLLHSMKPIVGNISFYLSLGGIMVFSQFVTAAGMNISDAYPGLDVKIGPTIFFTPLMAALLITYIVDGTLEAQRMILGIMGLVAIFLYFSYLSERQCDYPGYALDPSVPRSLLAPLFRSGRNFVLASLLSILVVFLVLPVLYQSLYNRNARLSVSVFAALIFTEVLDAFFYELVTNYPADDWWEELRQSYLTRAIAMTWVSFLTVVYLGIRRVPTTMPSDSRNALDIFTAFLGSYGQARRLQANVREWEGRYRMVVENSNDLILLVAESGIILDANNRAIETLGYPIDELATMKIQDISSTEDGESCHWPRIWNSLFYNNPADMEPSIPGNEWIMSARNGEQYIFDTTITPIAIHQSQATLLVARDITHRKQLEQDRETLHSQLMHSQRIEAVGKLAGGVAHDFNNLLHAIQGSLDVLDTVVRGNSKARELSSNITSAVKRASTLTGQLLGFARAGKYEVVRIDIRELIRQTEGLFRPLLGKEVEFKVVLHPDPMAVDGDFTQLEQVLLNLLLNARAALTDEKGTIVCRCEPATVYTPGWKKASDSLSNIDALATLLSKPDTGGSERSGDLTGRDATATHEIYREQIDLHGDDDQAGSNVESKRRNYIVLRVRDNGCGIDADTRTRIFEPFFTTKKNKGTGMGLAMVYGCVENHQGWIHVETEVGVGSEFFVFLPQAE